MKVLWVVNLLLPKVSHLVGEENVPFGGWVTNMIDQLADNENFEISVVMRAKIDEPKCKHIDNVTYYIIPQCKNNSFDVYQNHCDWVLKDANPDILHVEGSESAHALRFLKTWKGNNVVSMQGIINGYSQYEIGELKLNSSNLISTFLNAFDILALKINHHIRFKPRLKLERMALSYAKNILGRTHWDKSHSYFLNSSAPYYSCSRILRPGFYKNKWNLSEANRHQIFIGNSAQARKGAHVVLEAIHLLKNEYPDIKLIIAGIDPSQNGIIKNIGYRNYFKRKIVDLNLTSQVSFTGLLQEQDMISALCSSHVFVMSSFIENSPNTLGEAMMLGLPSITSYNGGVSDMSVDGQDVLYYRANDPVLLAMRIKQIFDSDNLAIKLSESSHKKAVLTHDAKFNVSKLINAYKKISERG